MVAVGPVRVALPVRAERRLAVLGELSWNGIAGFGPNLTFHAYPNLSIDLGAGLTLVGWKLGLRTRYNFLKSEVTPFIGVGLLAATGFDAPTQDVSAEDANPDLNIKLHPSAFMQGTIGIDYTDSDGFTFLGAVGYAWLLTHDNVEIVTGEPTRKNARPWTSSSAAAASCRSPSATRSADGSGPERLRSACSKRGRRSLASRARSFERSEAFANRVLGQLCDRSEL